jgi:hypothetical protein
MGPARYGAAGAMAYLRHACYGGTLEYLPADGAADASAPTSELSGSMQGGGGVLGLGALSQPHGGGGEKEEARVTLLRRRHSNESSPVRAVRRSVSGRVEPLSALPSDDAAAGDGGDGAPDGEECGNGPSSGDTDVAPASSCPPSGASGASDAESVLSGGDEAPDAPLRSALERASSLPRPGAKRSLLSAPGHPPLGWRAIPGPFHVVACAVISCRNDAAPHGIAPRAALADGCADLIAVRACSRPAYLRHLLRLTRPELGDHLDMEFVVAIKARAVRFTPAATASRWNVDGELLPPSANALQATVAPGLLTMFAFTPDDVK